MNCPRNGTNSSGWCGQRQITSSPCCDSTSFALLIAAHFGSSFTIADIAGSLESRAWIYISQNVPLGMMYWDRGFGSWCHCTLYNIVIGRSTLILLSWALLLQGCVRPPGWFFCSSKGCGGILCCNCTRILGWCCDTLGVQPLSCISIMKGLVECTHTLECRLKAIGRYLETCAWRVCCTDCFDSWAITWHNRKWLTHGYGQLEELKLFHVFFISMDTVELMHHEGWSTSHFEALGERSWPLPRWGLSLWLGRTWVPRMREQ